MRVAARLSFPLCGWWIAWEAGWPRRLPTSPLLAAQAARSSWRMMHGGSLWQLGSTTLVNRDEWWSVWGRPRRPGGLGRSPFPTLPPLSSWWRCGGRWQQCRGRMHVRGSLGGRVASPAPPSPSPPSSLLAAYRLCMEAQVARSADSGSRVHARWLRR
jgi:hypothetical protein